MRHARRFIATLIGIAFWRVAATTVAYAKRPDPVNWDVPPPSGPITEPTSGWQIVAIVALAALLTVAGVGLAGPQLTSGTARTSRSSYISNSPRDGECR